VGCGVGGRTRVRSRGDGPVRWRAPVPSHAMANGCPERATHTSPGQRPGETVAPLSSILEGCDIRLAVESAGRQPVRSRGDGTGLRRGPGSSGLRLTPRQAALPSTRGRVSRFSHPRLRAHRKVSDLHSAAIDLHLPAPDLPVRRALHLPHAHTRRTSATERDRHPLCRHRAGPMPPTPMARQEDRRRERAYRAPLHPRQDGGTPSRTPRHEGRTPERPAVQRA
jgi:hypothetical protein